VSRLPRALVLAVGLLAAGCDADPTPPRTTPPTVTATAATPSSTAPSTASSTAQPPPDGSGEVPLGDTLSIPVEAGTGTGTLNLTVVAIEVTDTCPGRAAPTQQPEFRHFVILEVTAQFDGSEGYLPLGADLFRVASPEGAVQAISTTDASWACFPDAELLPPFVDAGDEVSGRIVLDSLTAHGSVGFARPGEDPQWWWDF